MARGLSLFGGASSEVRRCTLYALSFFHPPSPSPAPRTREPRTPLPGHCLVGRAWSTRHEPTARYASASAGGPPRTCISRGFSARRRSSGRAGLRRRRRCSRRYPTRSSSTVPAVCHRGLELLEDRVPSRVLPLISRASPWTASRDRRSRVAWLDRAGHESDRLHVVSGKYASQ